MAKIHETKIKITSDHSKAVKGLKAVKGAAGSLVPSFNQVKTAALLTTAALIGTTVALWAMVKSTAKAGDEFDKMSKRLGVSVETLSELKFAAELSGASIEDIEKSMKKLTVSAINADRGLMTYTRAFDELGIVVTDNNGNLKTTEELFNEVSVALAKVENNTTKTALAQEIFGKSGSKLIPLFQEGAAGLEDLRAQARLLGITFTTEGAASAASFIDAQQRLTDSITGTKNSLSGDLMPPMTKFFNASAFWIANHREDVLGMARDWATSIGGMAQSVLVGGAEIVDFFGEISRALRSGDISKLQFEMQDLQNQIIAFERTGSDVPTELKNKLTDIALKITELQGMQIISEGSKDRAEKMKQLIAEIVETIRTAEIPEIVPRVLPEDEDKFEGLAGPKALAAQREIEQLNTMWEQHFLTESERLDIWYAEQEEKAAGDWGRKIQLQQIYQSTKMKLHNDELKAEKKKEATEKSLRKQGFSDFVGNLQAMGQTSKTAFEAWKLGAIAQTVIKTYEGAQGAYAAMSGIPIIGPALGAAAAAVAIGAGIARVNSIKSMSYSGGGGVSSGGGGGTPTVGGFEPPALPLVPEIAPVTEEVVRGQTIINIYPEGNLIDMSGVLDELAPFIEEGISDRVINLNVT